MTTPRETKYACGGVRTHKWPKSGPLVCTLCGLVASGRLLAVLEANRRTRARKEAA